MIISELFPSDTPGYMFQAWVDCLRWAIAEPKILAQFRAQTGNAWKPSPVPLGRMIDEAAGVEAQFLEEFIRWVNVNIWGPMSPLEELEEEAT